MRMCCTVYLLHAACHMSETATKLHGQGSQELYCKAISCLQTHDAVLRND